MCCLITRRYLLVFCRNRSYLIQSQNLLFIQSFMYSQCFSDYYMLFSMSFDNILSLLHTFLGNTFNLFVNDISCLSRVTMLTIEFTRLHISLTFILNRA